MATDPLTVHVDPDSELARALRRAGEAPVVLQSDGARFRVTRAEDDPDERERKRRQLLAELARGKEQERRGELIDFTPELLDRLNREAEENARRGKPMKHAVKP